MCDLDFVTDREGFNALEAEWNELFQRAGRGTQMFQTFNWLWHWCNYYLPLSKESHGPRLSIVTARCDGKLVMVWPLVRERSGPIIKLVSMGEPVSQYSDVLVADTSDVTEILRAAWRFIVARSGSDVVHLRKVRADAAVAPLMAEIGAFATETLRAPYLDLSSATSFADYQQRYSSGSRKKRRRDRRRLEDRGPITIEHHVGGSRARELVTLAISLKQLWLRARALVSPALADPRMARFFGDVANAAIRPAGGHVMAMMSNTTPAALEVGIRCKDRTATHIIVYDSEFEKVSPGALLMEESIRRALADGFSAFDLLAPADDYKMNWADGVVEVCDWAAPLSFAGSLYARVYLKVLRDAVKKAVAAFPDPLRRFIVSGLNLALRRR